MCHRASLLNGILLPNFYHGRLLNCPDHLIRDHLNTAQLQVCSLDNFAIQIPIVEPKSQLRYFDDLDKINYKLFLNCITKTLLYSIGFRQSLYVF